MDARRQKTQLRLAFAAEGRGEAPTAAAEGTEASAASRHTEGPARSTEHLMEEVCRRENLLTALRRVRRNKGSAGVDGMSVHALAPHLKEHWPHIREQLLAGAYTPAPVRRVSIPKPGGGVRKLGIPTVLDRFIQQALLQVLQGLWDPTFSEHSYGFRPGRSAHQAVAKAQSYMAEGYRWVVDIDLEKFFDRVNHDMLMGRVARRIRDKRVLKVIRAYLNAGVMEDGLVSPITEGTPQGGPLSPLLSNILLDDLDRELERRGHRFARYADDCNIYVRSRRAGRRVMAGVTLWLTGRLKLKVNASKSAVARPWERKFLGFTFAAQGPAKRRIAPQSLQRFQGRVRELTRRTRGVSLARMIGELGRYLTGWCGYYRFCQTPSVLRELDSWIRRRLRCMVWKQCKKGRARYGMLRRLGVRAHLAASTAASGRGPWRISHGAALQQALSGAYFDSLGLPRLAPD